jgi:predicted O-methyltransferase YrrM
VLAGDALTTLARLEGPYDVVFLDAWKDDYERLFALALPLVAPAGVVAADNVLSHGDILGPYSAARQADPRLLSVTIPLDSGLELTSVLSGPLHSG